jgi:hypothetical protein
MVGCVLIFTVNSIEAQNRFKKLLIVSQKPFPNRKHETNFVKQKYCIKYAGKWLGLKNGNK